MSFKIPEQPRTYWEREGLDAESFAWMHLFGLFASVVLFIAIGMPLDLNTAMTTGQWLLAAIGGALVPHVAIEVANVHRIVNSRKRLPTMVWRDIQTFNTLPEDVQWRFPDYEAMCQDEEQRETDAFSSLRWTIQRLAHENHQLQTLGDRQAIERARLDREAKAKAYLTEADALLSETMRFNEEYLND